MIKFEDFFKVEFPNKTKVKFNIHEGDQTKPAWDALRADEDSEKYQGWINMNGYKSKQSNNNYGNAEYVLTFAQYYPLGKKYYIFGGMYKIEKILPEVFKQQGYKLTLMDNFKEYRKRLIIKLKKSIGDWGRNRRFKNFIQSSLDAEIYAVTPIQIMEDFPGFNNVCLTHKELQYIFKNDAPEWKKQLSSVKGVYCITDTSTGKLYIGSAYGEYAGIWQRWQAYADVNNLTGGNKVFRELKKDGKEYIINNFTYTILEIFDTKTADNIIIERESYWKDVFQSRKFGMNKN